MTFPATRDLVYPGGVYADPEKLTDLVRFLLNANSGAVASSLVVKGSPGLLFGFTVSSIAAQFIQIFDASALPANTAVPTAVFPVAATNQVSVAWNPPRSFRNGLVICNSSTQHTKTIGSADCIFDVQFV
jgi:hypothetical protein